MGFWNFIHSIIDRVQGITPDLSTVKRAGGTAYEYTSTAAAKIEQVVRVDAIQKLPQYLPDSETKAKICIFTTKLIKNAGKYAVTEGFKHIPGCPAYSYSSAAAANIDQVVTVDGIEKLPQYLPDSETRAQIGLFTTKLAQIGLGATMATKAIADTMREVKQETDKDRMKAKVIRLEDFHSSKSQLEIISQNRHLILQNEDRGANKAKAMINMFMVREFVQNHMVRDIMVSKIA